MRRPSVARKPERTRSRTARARHRLVTYSVGQVPDRSVCFVPASVATDTLAQGRAPHVHSELPLTDRGLRRKFWWGEYRTSPHSKQQVVVSTEEVVALLDEGNVVEVISGPHATRQEAHDRADLAWEEPDD